MIAFPHLPHHLARQLPEWSITVRTALTGEVRLSGVEACDLAAAVELDRVHKPDAVALLTERRVSGEPLVWCNADLRRLRRRGRVQSLTDGADGLRREDAPSLITVVEALSRVGVEMLRCEVERPVDMGEVRKGLRQVGGAR